MANSAYPWCRMVRHYSQSAFPLPPQILAAKVYLSASSHNVSPLLEPLRDLSAACPAAALIHVFHDDEFARVGFTLAGPPAELLRAVLTLTGTLPTFPMGCSQACAACILILFVRDFDHTPSLRLLAQQFMIRKTVFVERTELRRSVQARSGLGRAQIIILRFVVCVEGDG